VEVHGGDDGGGEELRGSDEVVRNDAEVHRNVND
jgi:hypothetical protein